MTRTTKTITGAVVHNDTPASKTAAEAKLKKVAAMFPELAWQVDEVPANLETVRAKDVAALTKLSVQSIRRLVRLGDFPKGFKITGPNGKAKGWLKHEVEAWIAKKANRA